jgi:RNA polymerase sigma-70 factor (ECF subfamily)
VDESGLIQGCRRRERGAQRALYERHGDRVYRLALRLTGDEQDAFDVAQATFVRAFEQIDAFDGRAQLGTWLYRIATNEALQLFRRRKTERRHLRIVGAQQERATRPEVEAARLEIDDALARLSAEHRAILVLRYQAGLSYEEIAEVLCVASGTVASRLNRARAELRKLLGNVDAEENAPPTHPSTEAAKARRSPRPQVKP